MRWSMIGLAAGFAGAALLAETRPAEACSCMPPRIEVVPGPDAPAPVNTRVWVQWGLWYTTTADKPSNVPVILRAAKGKTAVSVARHNSVSANVGTIELRPHRPLAPKTTYEVVLGEGKKREVVGSFTTSAGKDKTPPHAVVKKHAYAHPEAVCCNCTTGDPYVTIDLAKVRGVTFLGVWRARGGRVDYSRPPDALVEPRRDTVRLGHPSMCSPANFDLPSNGAFRLGVRAIDLAGNLGAPQMLTVKVKPRKSGKMMPWLPLR